MGNQIETVRDMMSAIQEEIEQAKSGVLPVDTARVVFRGRALQLQTAQLNLQYQRLNRAPKNTNGKELNLITGVEVKEKQE
jgi:hypothetical protein